MIDVCANEGLPNRTGAHFRSQALTIGERKSSVLGEPPKSGHKIVETPSGEAAVAMSEQSLLLQPTRSADPMESLILAQDKRWRRALRMQVERSPTFGSVTEWQTAE